MGDKGSKKDKDKVKRQQVSKDKREEQKRLDKAPQGTLTRDVGHDGKRF